MYRGYLWRTAEAEAGLEHRSSMAEDRSSRCVLFEPSSESVRGVVSIVVPYDRTLGKPKPHPGQAHISATGWKSTNSVAEAFSR